jgi:hypothetical protein
MGEAWFMGDKRRMYDELFWGPEFLKAAELQRPLAEIASGTGSFGPRPEWQDWYHYLLGRLIPRGHERHLDWLLEILMTAFMAIYPNGIGAGPYPDFASDVLVTLGRCMMEPGCWRTDDEIAIGRVLNADVGRPQFWARAGGDLSASLFFCLKYLPPSVVGPWFRSVLKIKAPHWRAQVLVWLIGSRDMLEGRLTWPSNFSKNNWPSVDWDWSHCLGPGLAETDESGLPPVAAFLPEASRNEALAVMKAYFTDEVFLAWLTSIGSVPDVEAALGDLPSIFERLYLRRG